MGPIASLLDDHGLKKTLPRTEILNVFLKNTKAISHNHIEKKLGKDFDRVTIYRTLNSFEEKGLIHKVMTPSGEACYALCSTHCPEHNHQDNHVHFSCANCESVYCLTDVAIPTLKVPSGFQFKSFSLMVEGLCRNCFTKTRAMIKKKSSRNAKE